MIETLFQATSPVSSFDVSFRFPIFCWTFRLWSKFLELNEGFLNWLRDSHSIWQKPCIPCWFSLFRMASLDLSENVNGWLVGFDGIPDLTPTGETQSFKTIQNHEPWRMVCFFHFFEHRNHRKNITKLHPFTMSKPGSYHMVTAKWSYHHPSGSLILVAKYSQIMEVSIWGYVEGTYFRLSNTYYIYIYNIYIYNVYCPQIMKLSIWRSFDGTYFRLSNPYVSFPYNGIVHLKIFWWNIFHITKHTYSILFPNNGIIHLRILWRNIFQII